MNIFLAELLNSIPPEFSVKERKKCSILFQYKNKGIYVDWWSNGQPWEITYRENGVWHRPSSEGPAFQRWHKNGQPWEIAYHKNGVWHRPSSEGPAYQSWNEDGTLHYKEYWENGNQIKDLTKNK